MRTIAVLMTIALSFAAAPLAFAQDGDAQPGQDGEGAGGTPDEGGGGEATVQALMDRIAELEARLAELTGVTEPGETQGPCAPTSGCLDTPGLVDEHGDTITGDVHIINGKRLGLFPPDEQQDGLDMPPATFLGALGLDIHAPANFTDLVKLHENATLNTTGGAKVFIDFDGNLTFADGSFLNPAEGFANQNWTFTNDVNILRNLTIHEGGTIVFENNTSLLTAGNFSRIGTTTPHPFYIVANNETAIVVYPGPATGDAASIVAGHPENNVTAGTIGNFIAGGGSAAAPNLINGSWGIILGGSGNAILGDHAAAGGQDTSALHSNSFAWGDGSGPFQTSAPNTFVVNATGGFGINTSSPVSPLTVGGNITPSQNGTFSLGTPTHRWHQLYMASEIDFVTELLYTSGGATVMSLDRHGNLSFSGALTGDASGLTGITAASIEEGSITTEKLADGAVTAAKIGEVCPVGNVLKSDGSGWACALDVDTDTTYGAGTGLNLNGTLFVVDPTEVQLRVSASCAAGSSIRVIFQDGSVGCELDDDTDTDTDTLAALTCTALQVAKYDDLSETWVCSNDNDTTYGAGFGLDLQGTTFNVATGEIQRRVASGCPVGSSIRAILQDGSVMCETDTDTTYGASGPISLTGTTFGLEDCSVGEVYKFSDGNQWACASDDAASELPWSSITGKPAGFADDVDDDTTYAASGDALVLSDNVFSLSCGELTGLLQFNGDGWFCGDAEAGDVGHQAVGSDEIADGSIALADLGMACGMGEVVKESGGESGWVCADDDVATSLAWSAITDKPAGFADDEDDDTLGSLNCSTDQIIRWNGAAWACAEDTSPPRPGPGTIVGPFDADRDVALVAAASAVLCYVDDDSDGGFDVQEPLYLHLGVTACGGREVVSAGDLRLVPVGSHAAFTVVRAFAGDVGNLLSTYLAPGSVSNLVFFDADGNAFFNRGDTLYADRDFSGTTTFGDYRWTAYGNAHSPGTIVRPGDSDTNLVYRNLTSLTGKVAYWDLDANGMPGPADVHYLDVFATLKVGPNQSVRLGDLGAV